MAGHITSGAISMSDFYGARSHIVIDPGGAFGSGNTTFTRGYIKDYYGSGSHLGSLSTSAGVYIPSSGDTLNQFTEREVIACYTMHMYNSYGFNQKTFKLSLAGQIYSGNTFTGIREKLLNNNYTGQFTKALADATFSSASTFNTWDQWKWTITNPWGGTFKYIHWY